MAGDHRRALQMRLECERQQGDDMPSRTRAQEFARLESKRIQGLLEANNALVEREREAKNQATSSLELALTMATALAKVRAEVREIEKLLGTALEYSRGRASRKVLVDNITRRLRVIANGKEGDR